MVTNTVAFMTGSGTGAISTTLDLFAQNFLAMGFTPEVIHRIVAMSSEGFDSMSWNNFIVLVLTMANLSYTRSCKHVFIYSVVLTMDIIDDLDRELGIPVISSNSCAIWLIGTFFGKHGENAHKLGQLFKH